MRIGFNVEEELKSEALPKSITLTPIFILWLAGILYHLAGTYIISQAARFCQRQTEWEQVVERCMLGVRIETAPRAHPPVRYPEYQASSG